MSETKKQLPERKRPGHHPPVERFNQPVVLEVTVCTNGKKPVLADARTHAVLLQAWERALAWKVGIYVIMPDHIHLFCVPGQFPPFSVKRWVAYWKRLVSIECPYIDTLWQRDCWDTQMRSAAHYDEKLAYVRANPVRGGLARIESEWPFQGEMHPIMWR